jgi:hypothetical protein
MVVKEKKERRRKEEGESCSLGGIFLLLGGVWAAVCVDVPCGG